MTEFKIIEQTVPGAITFNYEELKAEIAEKAKLYETLVYTEKNIGDAKNDRASLNKLKKALNDERLRREREFMAPFEDFKTKVNEIIKIIDKPVAIIDKQVKDFEEQEKQKKSDEIRALYAEGRKHPEWLKIDQIWNEKWLNKSVSMAAVEAEIAERVDKIIGDMATLENLGGFAFEAMETYKQTLDLGRAIAEGQRLADIQKRKEEAEAKKAEEAAKRAEEPKAAPTPAPTPAPQPAPEKKEEPQGQWVKFEARLTREQAFALRDFFTAQGIEFRAIR